MAVSSILNSRVFKASSWVVGGFAFRQGMRLASNLILTRLLVPEYFGLMAIVLSTLYVVTMFTDVGIARSVINHDENDEVFFQTAWTLQVIQSVLVGIVTIVAAYPLASLYGEPDIFLLLVITGLAVCFKGFSSLGTVLSEKAVKPKLNIYIGIISQATSTIAMIIAAYYFRNVYAILLGAILDIFLKVGLSYLFFDKHYCQFRLDKKSAVDIFRFGKWIVVSSVLTTIVTQADAMIMGAWMPMEKLGKYAIASVFSGAIMLVLHAVSASVLHPRYRQLVSSDDGERQIKKIRLVIMLAFGLLAVFLAFTGGLIIDVLYDDRYQDSGWMLELLAVGKIGACMSATMLPLLLARGNSYIVMVCSFWAACILVACLFIFYSLYGSYGLILAYAVSPFLSHAVVLVLAKKMGYNFVAMDLILITLILTVIIVGWWVLQLGIFKVPVFLPS